jgi:hypothetical protein
MHLLSLHYSESRHTEFPAAKHLFYDQGVRSWISFDPETVVDLLRDERLIAPDTIGAIERLEARYKKQFPNLILAARAIPLLLNGQAHQEMRRRIAEFITEGRARTVAALPKIMKRYVEPLNGERQIEWISACIEPVVAEIGSLLCNSPDPVPYPKLAITRLFDRFASLSALSEADKQIAELRQHLGRSTPDIDPGIAIAILVLGRDSLTCTLATSLHSVLSRNLNRRFADMEFPDYPPETGVAVAERIASQAIALGAETIAAGDKVRLYFQPISGAGSTVNRQLLFGTGAHSCLGRHVSLDTWNLMTQTLRGFSGTVTSVAAEFEPNTMFIMPRYLQTGQSP